MGGRREGGHRRGAGLLLALAALPAAVLAGCLGGAPEEVIAAAAVPVVEEPLGPLVEVLADAAGDAFESSTDPARDAARLGVYFACAFASFAPERNASATCFERTDPEGLGHGAPRAGRPADPALDVRSLSFQASGATLAVELELGRMDETFDWVGRSSVVYQACWASRPPWMWNGTFCDHGVHLLVEPKADGSPVVRYAAYVDRGGGCVGTWPFHGCVVPVEYELLSGSPGRLRFEVPRDRMGNTTELERPFALTQRDVRLWADRAAVDTPPPPPFCCEPCPCYLDGMGFMSGVDDTVFGEPFPLPPAAPADSRVAVGHRAVDPSGDLLFGSAPDVDVLATTLVESADNLTLAVELAAVEDPPRPLVVWGQFGLPSRAVAAGVRFEGDAITQRGEFCSAMRAGWCSRAGDVAFDVAVTPGTPGWVNLTFARADLGFPVAGDTAHSIHALAYTFRRVGELPNGAPNRYLAQEVADLDVGPLAPAMALALGAPPRTDEGVPVQRTIEDDSFDQSQICINADCRRLDLLSLQATAASPTEVVVTIGVRDLSQVRPSPGYQAIVYAAGIRTSEGHAMVGYYRSDSSAGTFFCAPDTLVLAASPLDPTGVVWTTIQGVVSQGSTGQTVGQAGGNAGAITLHVPHECFGKEQPGPLHVEQFGAGAFLVRNVANRPGDGQVEQTDRVQTDEPFTIASVAPPAPPLPPWYTRDIFYNALGAFLAVVTIGFTLAVYYRRRRLMQWYLDELTRIDSECRDDAIQRAKGILALRRRLHTDIVKHRVSDSEYIRDRIRGSLTSARLVSLSDDYFDLPAPLTLRIERVLDDGRMTAEEGRLVEKVMQRVKLPEEGRALLIERIRTWVDEDASWG